MKITCWNFTYNSLKVIKNNERSNSALRLFLLSTSFIHGINSICMPDLKYATLYSMFYHNLYSIVQIYKSPYKRSLCFNETISWINSSKRFLIELLRSLSGYVLNKIIYRWKIVDLRPNYLLVSYVVHGIGHSRNWMQCGNG